MKPIPQNNGFTLIEILLALLVISVGLLSALGLLGTTLDTSSKSQEDIHAVSFADMVLNYCHTSESLLPVSGRLTLPDYNEQTADLALGSIDTFECRVPGTGLKEQTAYIVSYHVSIRERGSVQEVYLQVWPGYNTTKEPRRFYTELFRKRAIP